ncbi:hypothetical protein [Paenibacillus popilliae]|uniref:hypothetical protein n=1 Tax=Paenibacillus popilliae TaxID=78057 RepID=UPI000309334E|nr:hypothetical protein [Paenibacillus popilliae]
MRRHNVITDSAGATHVTAERRYLLYELCNRLRLDRRALRWSMNLRCHVLIVYRSSDKEAKPCSQRSDSPNCSPFGRCHPGADQGEQTIQKLGALTFDSPQILKINDKRRN